MEATPDPMKTMKCILDNCPETGRMVDYRRCDGYLSRPACSYFQGQDEIGEVNCGHPHAATADQGTQEINREVFHACGVMMHVRGPR